MVWYWPVIEGRDNCLPLISVFKFLSAAVLSAAMGCFFSCFRLGGGEGDGVRRDPPTADRSRYQVLSPEPEDAVPCNWSRLSSLFIRDEKEDEYGLEATGVEKQYVGTPEHELDVTELKEQAKFLKGCGTLQEAPVEIQNLSKESGDSSSQKVVSPKFNPLLSNSSIENQSLVEQPDQPLTPSKNCKEVMEGSDSSVLTPSSFMNDGEKSIGSSTINGTVSRNTPSFEINANLAQSYSVSSVSPAILPSSTRINKSVRFEFESDPTMSAKPFSSKFASLKSQHSPFPTPMKLTDEMQTPGTVFPAYINNMTNGKNPRVRYQYVHSTSNLTDDVTQLKELLGESSTSIQDSTTLFPTHMGESLEQPNETNLNSEVVLRETVANKELEVEASLSSSLHRYLNQEDSNHHGKTPGDRPILGVVAAHWHDHESSHISPKWWNGNGIPNTTTKYKEDQKVSWHATPFEERLEKALSDETLVSQRKQISVAQPIQF